MAKFFTHRRTLAAFADVNMTPLVDLVCTLLIIFMIVAPMLYKGIDVQLPRSSVGEDLTRSKVHIVTITAQGGLWFDGEPVRLDGLWIRLQQLAATESVYIQSDKDTSYGQLIDVITLIKKRGLHQVGLITSPEPKRQP